MEPINRKSIRKRSIRFWGLFTLLLVFTTLPVYRLLWMAEQYRNMIETAWKDYYKAKQEGDRIHASVEALLDQINRINTTSKRGFGHSEQQISVFKKTMDETIGPDSPGLFAGYAHISRGIPIIMQLKRENISSQSELQGLKKQYDRLRAAYPERYQDYIKH